MQQVKEELYGYIFVEEPGVFGVFEVRQSPSWRYGIWEITASPEDGGAEKLFKNLDVVKRKYTLHASLDDAYNELYVLRSNIERGTAEPYDFSRLDY